MIRNVTTSALGLAFGLALALFSNAGPASAQSQSLTIQAPDGGDCTSSPLNGTWDGRVCRLNTLSLGRNHGLNIKNGAIVRVENAGANFGTIAIVDRSILIVGARRSFNQFVNIGSIVLMPAPGFIPPKLVNRMEIVNQGTIFNASRGKSDGVVENLVSIVNSGKIINNGFLLNSGPSTRAPAARIRMIQGGTLDSQQGRIENGGEISGTVFGTCPGNC